MDRFKLVSEYKPSGDQPEAIEALANGVNWDPAGRHRLRKDLHHGVGD